MFDSDGEEKLWIGSGIVVLAAMVALHVFHEPAKEPQRAKTVAEQERDVAVHEPAVAPTRDYEPPYPMQTSARPIAVVYECTVNGVRSMSSHPCGPDARVREVSAPNRMDAQDTSNLYRPVYQPSRTYYQPSSGGVSGSNKAFCDQIDEEVERIDARMRHGYRVWEGERLKGRRRDLKAQRWDAKCGR